MFRKSLIQDSLKSLRSKGRRLLLSRLSYYMKRDRLERRSLLLFVLFCSLTPLVLAQEDIFIQTRPGADVPIHQEDFSLKKLHFGFFVGANLSHYYIYQATSGAQMQLRQKPGAGLTVGLLGEWHVLPYLSLRFMPDFSLENRTLIFEQAGQFATEQPIMRSIFNLPLLLRVQAMRLGNFGFHVSAGGGVSIDITSYKNLPDYIITKQAPFFISFGLGMDAFLEFFKMGFELRCDIGLGDQLLRQNVALENHLERLRLGALRLIISFEG